MKILICGDYIAHTTLKNNTVDIFGDFLEVIRRADFAIYNQEHPVTRCQNVYSTKRYGTTHACNPDLVRPIIDAGFKYVTLATNHILNRGYVGIKDTMEFFRSNGITPVGAGKNLEEACRVCYFEKEGQQVALINMAENEYCSATKNHAGSHPLDTIENARLIKTAKTHADYLIVIIHGGIEYCSYPTPRQVQQSRFYVECGASIVVWHHSHYVSGWEIYNGSPIYYGIGNFIPAKPVSRFMRDPLTRYSYSVEIEIDSHGELRTKGYPLKFNIEKCQLEWLKGDELTQFQLNQEEVNRTLSDSEKLRNLYVNQILTGDRLGNYLMYFLRSHNLLRRLLKRFQLAKLWLWYLNARMRMNLVNTFAWGIIRCETHRDMMKIIYETYVDTYRNQDDE